MQVGPLLVHPSELETRLLYTSAAWQVYNPYLSQHLLVGAFVVKEGSQRMQAVQVVNL